MDDTTLQRAKQSFLQGLEHFQASRLKESESSFAISLALVPDRVSTLINLGATQLRLGKPMQAAPLLVKAANADPGNVEAWFNLGVAQRQLGAPDKAIYSLERALALNPEGVPVLLQAAQTLGILGRLDDALAMFDKVITLQPGLGQAWSDRGTLLREQGRLEEASQSFARAIELGADVALNQWFLSSVTEGAGAPDSAPREYVERLFDDYAHEFGNHLVDTLGYRAPDALIGHLQSIAPRRFASVLDLGCGTGLCGNLLKPSAGTIDGVDLSARMLGEAARTQAYRALVHADVVSYLEGEGAARRDDLVVAADVFIYVGALEKVFTAVARILVPDGLFCFTVELPDDGEDLQLMPSLRYAHSDAYIRKLAQANGFSVTDSFVAPIRNDQGEPVEGTYFYLARQ
ncbi:MAG: tetratricopeptide repeat protein [Comamonadaceae bacterium]|nr:MAG: tetratricopeptide repeat protein [Comamonadaceae bacterium]